MAIPGSGTIGINTIVQEFGGSAPHALSEYYRGGPLVGTNNTDVPTSGTIAISDFYGAENASFITAQGGSTSTQGNFTRHTFTGPGTFTVQSVGNSAGSNTVDFLVVAGGGGGGGHPSSPLMPGGGGGAGCAALL